MKMKTIPEKMKNKFCPFTQVEAYKHKSHITSIIILYCVFDNPSIYPHFSIVLNDIKYYRQNIFIQFFVQNLIIASISFRCYSYQREKNLYFFILFFFFTKNELFRYLFLVADFLGVGNIQLFLGACKFSQIQFMSNIKKFMKNMESLIVQIIELKMGQNLFQSFSRAQKQYNAHQEIKKVVKAIETMAKFIKCMKNNSAFLEVPELQKYIKNVVSKRDITSTLYDLLNFLQSLKNLESSFYQAMGELKKKKKSQEPKESKKTENPFKAENNNKKKQVELSFVPQIQLLEAQPQKVGFAQITPLCRIEYIRQKGQNMINHKKQLSSRKNQINKLKMNRSEQKKSNPENEEDEYDIMFQQIPSHIENTPLKQSIMSNHQEPIMQSKLVEMENLTDSCQFQMQSRYHQFKIIPEANKEKWDNASNTLEKLKYMLDSIPKEIQAITNQKNLNQQTEKNIDRKFEKLDFFYQFSNNEKIIKEFQNQVESLESQKIKMYEIPIQLHLRTSKLNDGETTNESPEYFEKRYSYFQYAPQFQVCSQVISFSFFGNENGDLSSSKKGENDIFTSFVGTQSMVEQISMKVGKNPIYFLNNDNESDQDRSILNQQKLSICLNQNSLKGFRDPLVEPAQYYEMKQKAVTLEQEKGQLFQQLKIADSDIKTMKQEILLLKKQIENIKSQEKQTFEQLKNEAIIAQNSLLKNEIQSSKRQKQILQLREANKKLEEEYKKVSELLKDRRNLEEDYKIEFQELRKFYSGQIEKLNSQILQKDEIIEELESCIEESRYEHKVDFLEFEKMVDSLKQQIDDLNKEVQHKKNQLEKLGDHQNDLIHQIQNAYRKKSQEQYDDENIESIEQAHEIERIYSGEMQKMKQQYDEILLQKAHRIDSFRLENEQLRGQIQELCEKSVKDTKLLEEYRDEIKILKDETEKCTQKMVSKKFSLSIHYEDELELLRTQVFQKNNVIEVKQNRIKQLSFQNRKLKKPETCSFSIDFVNNEDQSIYIFELKQIISQYEKMIISTQKFVRQLESSTEEFIKDLIQKQKQVEKLESIIDKSDKEIKKLQQENRFLEVDNKKMWKMIVNSGKQINAISSKMKSKQQKERIYEDSSSLTLIQKEDKTTPLRKKVNISDVIHFLYSKRAIISFNSSSS